MIDVRACVLAALGPAAILAIAMDARASQPIPGTPLAKSLQWQASPRLEGYRDPYWYELPGTITYAVSRLTGRPFYQDLYLPYVGRPFTNYIRNPVADALSHPANDLMIVSPLAVVTKPAVVCKIGFETVDSTPRQLLKMLAQHDEIVASSEHAELAARKFAELGYRNTTDMVPSVARQVTLSKYDDVPLGAYHRDFFPDGTDLTKIKPGMRLPHHELGDATHNFIPHMQFDHPTKVSVRILIPDGLPSAVVKQIPPSIPWFKPK